MRRRREEKGRNKNKKRKKNKTRTIARKKFTGQQGTIRAIKSF